MPAAAWTDYAAYLVDADGRHPQRLPVRHGVMSPDSRWIAGVRAEKYRWELVLVHPDGAGEHTVLARSYREADLPEDRLGPDPLGIVSAVTPHHLAWSPDGRQFAFVSAMNWDPKGPPIKKQVELYIYDLPSGRLTQVTHDNLEQCTPVWTE